MSIASRIEKLESAARSDCPCGQVVRYVLWHHGDGEPKPALPPPCPQCGFDGTVLVEFVRGDELEQPMGQA